MKESKKRIIGLGITLGACALIAVGSAYAWFNTVKHVQVSKIEVSVINAYDLRLSLDNITYRYNVAEDFSLNECKQISGNGQDFYSILTGYGTADSDGVSNKVVTGYKKIDEEDYNDYLYYKEVYLTVEKNIDLYLEHTSAIIPADLTERINDFGKSRDYVAGAIRFGIVDASDEDGPRVPLFIWAPNSTYEYSESSGTKDVITNGTVEDYYRFATGTSTYAIEGIATESEENGSVTKPSGLTFAWGDLPSSNQFISEIPAGSTTLAFAIWLEGTDRECVLDLSGGEVSVSLKFTSRLAGQ